MNELIDFVWGPKKRIKNFEYEKKLLNRQKRNKIPDSLKIIMGK